MQACPLKPSEKQMLQMLADGKQLKQIATAIGAPISTIHSTMQRIRARIETGETIAALVAHALRKGWIQ